MKTIFDELKQEVKNWWISLILGRICGIKYFIQCFHAGQRFAGNLLCGK